MSNTNAENNETSNPRRSTRYVNPDMAPAAQLARVGQAISAPTSTRGRATRGGAPNSRVTTQPGAAQASVRGSGRGGRGRGARRQPPIPPEALIPPSSFESRPYEPIPPAPRPEISREYDARNSAVSPMYDRRGPSYSTGGFPPPPSGGGGLYFEPSELDDPPSPSFLLQQIPQQSGYSTMNHNYGAGGPRSEHYHNQVHSSNTGHWEAPPQMDPNTGNHYFMPRSQVTPPMAAAATLPHPVQGAGPGISYQNESSTISPLELQQRLTSSLFEVNNADRDTLSEYQARRGVHPPPTRPFTVQDIRALTSGQPRSNASSSIPSVAGSSRSSVTASQQSTVSSRRSSIGPQRNRRKQSEMGADYKRPSEKLSRDENRLVKYAKNLIAADICTVNAYPDCDIQNSLGFTRGQDYKKKLVREAINMANVRAKEENIPQLEFTADIIAMVHKNITSTRSNMKAIACTIISDYPEFLEKITAEMTPLERKARIAENVADMCNKDLFLHMIHPGDNEPAYYNHPIFHRFVSKALFQPDSSVGREHSRRFLTEFPSVALALAATCVLCALQEWKNGVHRPSKFDANVFQPRYDIYLQEINRIRSGKTQNGDYFKARFEKLATRPLMVLAETMLQTTASLVASSEPAVGAQSTLIGRGNIDFSYVPSMYQQQQPQNDPSSSSQSQLPANDSEWDSALYHDSTAADASGSDFVQGSSGGAGADDADTTLRSGDVNFGQFGDVDFERLGFEYQQSGPEYFTDGDSYYQ